MLMFERWRELKLFNMWADVPINDVINVYQIYVLYWFAGFMIQCCVFRCLQFFNIGTFTYFLSIICITNVSMLPVILKSDFSCVEQFLDHFLLSIQNEVL